MSWFRRLGSWKTARVRQIHRSILLVQIVVIGPWRHGGRALQELRRVVTWLAQSRALEGIAAKLGLQLHQIGEDVGLAPQLVGDHRRLARNRRGPGNPDARPRPRFAPR